MGGTVRGIRRRDLLKVGAGVALAGVSLPRRSFAKVFENARFSTHVHEVCLYMTHYAYFEEPDDDVPPAIYVDVLTGGVTGLMNLTAPVVEQHFERAAPGHANLVSVGPETSKIMPYLLSPPGFPALPAPPPVVGVVKSMIGLPADLIVANTRVILMAIGEFKKHGEPTGKLAGRSLRIQKDVHFVVQLRPVFLFQPPPYLPVPAIGVIAPYVTLTDLHGLLGLPPPAFGGSDIVTYSWRSQMELSTENRYIRSTATEPAPVAKAFDPEKTEIRMVGMHVDEGGMYSVVGSVLRPEFDAPPILLQFLFGTTNLTDVEFVVEEMGMLVPM